MNETEQVKKALRKKKSKSKVKRSEGLSSGSTMLNLACSGWPDVAFFPGHYYFVVGDSSSGKTFLVLTCLAEASITDHFDDYRFILDAPENGALMDFERFFGKRMAKRLETPEPSATVEEWYDRQQKYLDDGRPFISILDSMDVLDSKEDLKHLAKQKKATAKGQKETGSYGMGKAKANSTRLRGIVRQLKSSGSILIIISQTRDNIGFGFETKTRAGGRALKFYATLEMWSEIKQRIKRKIRDKDRVIGVLSRVKVKKNRIQGKERTVDIPIYHSVGFDDIGSCIDYLVEEKHWKKGQGGIKAPEFEFTGTKEKLIRLIEEEDSLEDLRNIVAEVWNDIEAACAVERKNRYE